MEELGGLAVALAVCAQQQPQALRHSDGVKQLSWESSSCIAPLLALLIVEELWNDSHAPPHSGY